MIVKQIRSTDGTGTLSYMIIDEDNKIAAIIDPNIEDTKDIILMAGEMGVQVSHIIDTHTHADHVSGADELRKFFNAKTYMHERTKYKMDLLKDAAKFGIEGTLNANAKITIDHYLNDNDSFDIGSLKFKVIHTPGHTDNHISVLVDKALFTGDLLLIGQAGRSDLPGGNAEDQYESLYNKVLELPGDTKIYPGHDYEENEFSYLKDERKDNPFLQPRSKEEFVEFVEDFFPPFAETSSDGGKMTLQCGAKRIIHDEAEFKSISAADLFEMIKIKQNLFLLDVREPFELMMTGAVKGVKNIPIGELPGRVTELPEDKSKDIVCICASGNRSYEASHFLVKKGYKKVMNLDGGTYGWLDSGYATER
jgi:glyoxylase-like metal-dependent hydrolase (beta-lactamase superfamily II)/rhodanese-related sulfurtransferase